MLTANTNTHYASFLQRTAAVLVDSIVLLVPQSLVYFLLITAFINRFGYTDPEMIAIAQVLWGNVTGLVIAWIYFASTESSAKKATIGKMILRLTVVDSSGNALTFGRASARYWLKLISAIPFGAGFLLALFTKRKQALHDILAKAYVIQYKRDTSICANSEIPPSFYLAAHNEIGSELIDNALWIKSCALYPNDESQQKYYYISTRALQLQAEALSISPDDLDLSKAKQHKPSDYREVLTEALKTLKNSRKHQVAALVALLLFLSLITGIYYGVTYFYNNVYWTTYRPSSFQEFTVIFSQKNRTIAYIGASKVKYRYGKAIYIYKPNQFYKDNSYPDPVVIFTQPFSDVNIVQGNPFSGDDIGLPYSLHHPVGKLFSPSQLEDSRKKYFEDIKTENQRIADDNFRRLQESNREREELNRSIEAGFESMRKTIDGW